MPVLEKGSAQTWRRRTTGENLFRWFGWLIGVRDLCCFAGRGFPRRPPGSSCGTHLASRAISGTRATPPRWTYITQLGRPIWDTLNIATLGTLIAICLAVPVAFMAARNTTPSVLFIRPVALLVIVSSRSINSLIWALLLIAIIGPGVFAGVIAIAIRSIGFCGKAPL